MSVYIREPPIDAAIADGQGSMIEAEQVQNGCVDIVHLCRRPTVERLVSPLVARPVGRSTTDASTTEPVGEAMWIVVAPFAALSQTS